MTLRYAHLAPGQKVKAVELLDNKMNYHNNTAKACTDYTKTIQLGEFKNVEAL